MITISRLKINFLYPVVILYFAICHGQDVGGTNEIDHYFDLSVGTINLKCPPHWSMIAASCFKIGTSNGAIVSATFDEASILCNTPDNLYSTSLFSPNWFTNRDLARVYNDLWANNSVVIWTAFFLDSNGTLPTVLKIKNSDSTIGIHSPNWANNEPVIPKNNLNCVAFNTTLASGDYYGWKVLSCSTALPTICQTFTCYGDEFRCADNAKCIPSGAVCDGLNDCPDMSDEANCTGTIQQYTVRQKSGLITMPASYCKAQGCQWDIALSSGSTARINFLNLKLDADDSLVIVSKNTGEKRMISAAGPYANEFEDTDIQIKYIPAVRAANNNHGFQLQYWADDSQSCYQTFTLSNGSFSPPVNQFGFYRPLLRCKWRIEKISSTPVTLLITNFNLAPNDTLTISEFNGFDETVIGTFTDTNFPPSVVTSISTALNVNFQSSQQKSNSTGFYATFQQTCTNIYLNETYGIIQSPGFLSALTGNFECSWVIDTPCEHSSCGITLSFLTVNLTDKDLISISSDNEEITVDSSALPLSNYRISSNKAVLKMKAKTSFFAAQVLYSIDCTPPDFPSYVNATFLNANPFAYNSEVVYTCSSDNSQTNSRCDEGGIWSEPPPSCRSGFCIIPNITGIIITKVENPSSGSRIVNYQCRFPYYSDSSNSTCVNGVWVPPLECKTRTCQMLAQSYTGTSNKTYDANPANLFEITGPIAGSYPQKALYYCPEGMNYLRGLSRTRYCKTDGSWTSAVVYCKPVFCADTFIENGYILQDYVALNETVDIHCFKGYENPYKKMTCVGENEWEPKIERCTPTKSCTTSDCQNRHCEIVGEKIECLCDAGYRQSFPNGPCEDIDECTTNLHSCASGALCLNTNGSYLCLFPPNETHALFTSTTNGVVPNTDFLIPERSIIRKRCKQPEFHTDSAILSPKRSLYFSSSKLRVYCQNSLNMAELECSQEGQWSGDVQCPDEQLHMTCTAQNVPGLEVTPRKEYYSIGDLVTFNCKPGFQLIGPSLATCSPAGENGTIFHGELPICIKQQCARFETEKSDFNVRVLSAISEEYFEPGTIIEVSCRGNQRSCPSESCTILECNSDLTWNGTLPKCSYQFCQIPENDVLFASKANAIPGETVEFSCRQPNYVLQGPSRLTCTSLDRTTIDLTTSCIEDRNDKYTANVNDSALFYCKLKSSCANNLIAFRHKTKDVLLDGQCDRQTCFTILSAVTMDDAGDIMCSVLDSVGNVIENAVSKLVVLPDFGLPWSQRLRKATSREHVVLNLLAFRFMNATKSMGWNALAETWQLDSVSGKRNYLIIPIVDTELPNAMLQISASELNADCRLSVSYFTANFKITDVPDNKFITIFHNSASQTEKIATLPDLYPNTWISVQATGCTSAKVTKLRILKRTCSELQIGNTVYQPTGAGRTTAKCISPTDKNVFETKLNCRHDGRWEYNERMPLASCFPYKSYSDLSPVDDTSRFNETLPRCIDNQPARINCPDSLEVVMQSDFMSEPTTIVWPYVIDNDPHFRIYSNLPLTSHPYIFDGTEKQIVWTLIDRHGKSFECKTEIFFKKNTLKLIECPEMYIDKRNSTESRHLPLRLPDIQENEPGLSLTYSMTNGTIIEVNKPMLINVTAVNAAGRMTHCQFWHVTEVDDCPLWQIDQETYICMRTENLTVCYRRQPCTTREVPFPVKAIICIPGHGWRLIRDQQSITNLNATSAMLHVPVCIEQTSSSITLSLTFRFRSKLNCGDSHDLFAKQMERFMNEECPTVGWRYAENNMLPTNATFNYMTTNPDTESVLKCIADVTNTLAGDFTVSYDECFPTILSHSITYHVFCATGWGSNTNLKCEKCPPGFFSKTDVCAPCPIGTYADQGGAARCTPCESGTTTADRGSISESECVPFCGRGYFSDTGHALCLPCPQGTFQEEIGQTNCRPCGIEMSTTDIASASSTNCLRLCAPGSFSPTGLETCTKCPVGFYQEDSGKTECTRCKAGFNTASEGSASQLLCQPIFCDISTCKNGGKCKTDGTCYCQQGFGGVDCSVAINLCDAAYCLNGGFCEFNGESTTCSCSSGFTGSRCEKIDIPSVSFSDLQNNCTSDLNLCKNGFCALNGSCSCPERLEYKDGICIPSNLCYFHPCVHGKCRSKSNQAFECACDNGWFGDFCEKDFDCQKCAHGDCLPFVNETGVHYTCLCDSDYSGEFCDTKLSPCNHNNCIHGTCVPFGSDFYCQCEKGYAGEMCETELSPCYTSDNRYFCQHGGTCESQNGTAYCICPPFQFGERCENVKTDIVCANGGTLIDNQCICPVGFTGSTCNIEINPCSNPPMNDYMTCGTNLCKMNTPGYFGNYTCNCPNQSSNCSIPPDPDLCSNKTCMHGTCVMESPQKAVCVCNAGFDGDDCTKQYSLCHSKICLNGECQEFNETFYCQCKPGYIGANCETQSACADVNCVNGVCDSSDGHCECYYGWEGETCDQSITFCTTNYCQNGGTCVNYGASGYCNCKPGYMGTTCQYKNDRNYNLQFTGIYPQVITSVKKDIQLLQTFAICSWVKYAAASVKETVAEAKARMATETAVAIRIIYSNSSSELEILRISASEVAINQGERQASINMTPGWNHICVQTDGVIWKIFLNYTEISAQIWGPYFFPSGNFSLSLGSTYNMDMSSKLFAGELSYTEVYNRTFTDAQVSDMVLNCIEWSTPSSHANEMIINWAEYENPPFNSNASTIIRPGVCYTVPCIPGSADCTNKDRTPPYVKYCPQDIFISSPTRLAVLNIPNATLNDMFEDESPIVKFESNYYSGQVLVWGQYLVIYSATDAENNTAFCQFTVTISPEPQAYVPLKDSNFNVTNVSIIEQNNQTQAIGILSCPNENYVVAHNKNPFYIRDLMGRWTRYGLYGAPYTVPQCVEATPSAQTMEASVFTQNLSETCQDIENNIIYLLASKTPYCTGDCRNQLSFGNCNSNNQSTGTRKKRAADVREVSFQFFVNTSFEIIQDGVVDALEVNFNVTEAKMVSITCGSAHPLNVTSDNRVSCAECGKGYYADGNKAIKCPPNTYKSTSDCCEEKCCLPCPNGMISPQNTVNINDCYLNCSIGSYYNDTEKKCIGCKKGHYQDQTGQYTCRFCSNGLTTNYENSTSINDCVPCNLGQELNDNEICQPCKIGQYGYYYEKVAYCKPCDEAFTTHGEGSVSPFDCNVINCPMGYHVKQGVLPTTQVNSSVLDICDVCSTGTYQDQPNATLCINCPVGQTTDGVGSTSSSYCKTELGQCDPNPNITNHGCPDGYQCLCEGNDNFGSCRGYKCMLPYIKIREHWWIAVVASISIVIVTLIGLFALLRYQNHAFCTWIRLPEYFPKWMHRFLKPRSGEMRVRTVIRSRSPSLNDVPINEPENIDNKDSNSIDDHHTEEVIIYQPQQIFTVSTSPPRVENNSIREIFMNDDDDDSISDPCTLVSTHSTHRQQTTVARFGLRVETTKQTSSKNIDHPETYSSSQDRANRYISYSSGNRWSSSEERSSHSISPPDATPGMQTVIHSSSFIRSRIMNTLGNENNQTPEASLPQFRSNSSSSESSTKSFAWRSPPISALKALDVDDDPDAFFS